MNEIKRSGENYMERARVLITLAIEALESAENGFAAQIEFSRISVAAEAKLQLIIARKALINEH